MWCYCEFNVQWYFQCRNHFRYYSFLDTFALYNINASGAQIPWTYEGIIWDVDRDKKFKNPDIPPGGSLCDAFQVRA